MKVGNRASPAADRDPRTEPLPLAVDETGLAAWVQSAPTAEEAWARLGLPGGRDGVAPAALEALAMAATRLCALGDALGQGLRHFGALPDEADPPESWVDRMVELHAQHLAAWWALDELAYAGLREGGWTVSTATEPPPTEAGRVARRARWVLEEVPSAPSLAIDKLERALGAASRVGTRDEAKAAAHALVAAAVRRRFGRWRQERRRP